MQQLPSVVKQTKLQTTGACGQAVILQILAVAAQASIMTHKHLRDGAFRYLDNTLHCEVNTFYRIGHRLLLFLFQGVNLTSLGSLLGVEDGEELTPCYIYSRQVEYFINKYNNHYLWCIHINRYYCNIFLIKNAPFSLGNSCWKISGAIKMHLHLYHIGLGFRLSPTTTQPSSG